LQGVSLVLASDAGPQLSLPVLCVASMAPGPGGGGAGVAHFLCRSLLSWLRLSLPLNSGRRFHNKNPSSLASIHNIPFFWSFFLLLLGLCYSRATFLALCVCVCVWVPLPPPSSAFSLASS
jgi:hypothetical protein